MSIGRRLQLVQTHLIRFISTLEEEATNYLLNKDDTDPLYKYTHSFIKEELDNIKTSRKFLLDGSPIEPIHLLSCIKLMCHIDRLSLPEERIGMVMNPLYQEPVRYGKDILTGTPVKIVLHLSEEEATTDMRLDLLSYTLLSSSRWRKLKKILYSEVVLNLKGFLYFLEKNTLRFLERDDVNENIKTHIRNSLKRMKINDSFFMYDAFSIIGYVFGEKINITSKNPYELTMNSTIFKNYIENQNNSKRVLRYLQDIGKSLENTRLVDIAQLTTSTINPVFKYLYEVTY